MELVDGGGGASVEVRAMAGTRVPGIYGYQVPGIYVLRLISTVYEYISRSRH